MKPDGSGREQLTIDEYSNWFPHISPDGKWIAFISFRPDVEPKWPPFIQTGDAQAYAVHQEVRQR